MFDSGAGMANFPTADITDVYADESLHPDLGIAVVALVFGSGQAIDVAVDQALGVAGLQPGVDEFKATAPYGESESLRAGRDQLLGFAALEVALGVAVVPLAARPVLGAHVLKALRQLARINGIELARLRVHVDQGLFPKPGNALTVCRAMGLDVGALNASADSVTTRGVQLADLVANVLARIIRERSTGHEKTIVEREEGLDDMALSWHLKMGLRWALFSGPFLDASEVPADVPLVSVYPYAVYAEGLPSELQQAVESAFGTAWLGCTS